MQYELLENSNAGVIIDSTPIFRDVKGTYNVSFILPHEGIYVALFRDENGIEYRAPVKNGIVKVPRQLLDKEQIIGLTVCCVYGENIHHVWECHAMKISSFLSLRKTQWQITAGVNDGEVFTRIAEMERHYAQVCANSEDLKEDTAKQLADMKNKFDVQFERYEATLSQLSILTEKYNAAVENYNAAIDVINALGERVAALEANYDPTIIK